MPHPITGGAVPRDLHDALPAGVVVPAAAVVGAGDLVRLTAGMRATWTVHETLRTLYVAPPG
jgi:hypothetical protein